MIKITRTLKIEFSHQSRGNRLLSHIAPQSNVPLLQPINWKEAQTYKLVPPLENLRKHLISMQEERQEWQENTEAAEHCGLGEALRQHMVRLDQRIAHATEFLNFVGNEERPTVPVPAESNPDPLYYLASHVQRVSVLVQGFRSKLKEPSQILATNSVISSSISERNAAEKQFLAELDRAEARVKSIKEFVTKWWTHPTEIEGHLLQDDSIADCEVILTQLELDVEDAVQRMFERRLAYSKGAQMAARLMGEALESNQTNQIEIEKAAELNSKRLEEKLEEAKLYTNGFTEEDFYDVVYFVDKCKISRQMVHKRMNEFNARNAKQFPRGMRRRGTHAPKLAKRLFNSFMGSSKAKIKEK